MNGIFPADVALYLLFMPIIVYMFMRHSDADPLAYYYLGIFSLARIVGGGLGIHDSSSFSANIIQSVALSPLMLAVDGLTHEARKYRFPGQYKILNRVVIGFTSVAMAAAVAISIVGALHVYEAEAATPPKQYEAVYYNLWKAGASLVVVVWGVQVGWCAWSYLDRNGRTKGPEEKYTTTLLHGSAIALVLLAIRAWYNLAAVVTLDADLNPMTATTAVRVVLMFLPEAFATIFILAAGFLTKHLGEIKPFDYA